VSVRERTIRAARKIAATVPDPLLAKLLPPALRWDQRRMQPTTAPPGSRRLLIAPTNSAGQAFFWARAARTHLEGVGAANYMTTNDRTDRYAFATDNAVPEMGFNFARGWQKRQRHAIVEGFSHVLVESGRHIYGPLDGLSPLEEMNDIARCGVKVGMLWHGSDIRLPSAHAAAEPDSPFGVQGGYPPATTATLEANATSRRRMVIDSAYPTFVSTPGLLDVPRSRWLPVVIDAERWWTETVPFTRDRPVVVYAPSNSAMKGDPSIDAQLLELEAAELIEYRRLGGVRSSEMTEVYREADIVLDQFRLGDYGVAACEAMAAGCVVIGHVHDDVRAIVLAQTGRELPILESRFGAVGPTIHALISDQVAARERASAGVEFVRAVHDGRRSALVLSDFLGGDIRD